MAVRREKIVLELDDQATSGLLRAAAAAKLLDDAVSGVGGSTRTSSRETDRLGSSSRKAGRDLDELERRARGAERGSSALVDSVVALAPALVPVGAVAIPALAGLTAQLGFAAAAGGTMLLAFNGVGDALKALDAYKDDPTAANLAKMREEMEKLGPAGRDFVRELSALEPTLRDLRATAQAGLLPGVTASIDDLLTRLPQIKAIIAEVSDVTGDLFARAGNDVAGGGFDEFFAYLSAEARPILSDTAAAVGNLTHTFANLVVATAPLQRDFTGWLRNATQDLEGWSAGLGDSQGFSDFLDYLANEGPKVGKAVGAISNALVQVVQAGAPLGGPTLTALTALANVVAEIADSPVGTPLIALASGLALVNRALAVRDIARTSPLANLITGSSGGPLQRSRGQLQGLRSDLAAVNRVGFFAGTKALASPAELEKSAAAAGRLGGRLRNVGRGAAGIGAVAVASTGLGDKLGVTNTASLALAGTLAGPMGAGAGAAVGALLDLRAAGEQTAQVFDRVDRAAGSTDYSELTGSLAKMRSFLDHGGNISTKLFGAPDASAAQAVQVKINNLTSAYKSLAKAAGTPLPANASSDQIEQFAARVQPVLDAAGVSMSKLTAGSKTELAKAKAALAELGIEFVQASNSAKSFNQTLTLALNPKMSLDQARDELAKTINSLSQLNRAAGLKGNSAGALGNRELVRGAVSQTQELLKVQADAGKGTDVLAATLQRSRRQILAQGEAAGISRRDMNAYLASLGLTPRLVQTLIRANVDEARGKVRGFLQQLGLTPSQVKTVMNADTSKGTGPLKRYLQNLGLTPAQVKTTLAAFTSAANGNINKTKRNLDDYGRRNPKATLGAKNFASGVIDSVIRDLNALNGKTATTYVKTIRTSSSAGVKAGGAAGVQSALGNLFGSVRQFAWGSDPDDLRNNHQPKLYGPGTARVFREEETGGEGYVPMRNDHRRPRAKAITQEIVHRFGGTVQWNALGSLTPGKDYADYQLSVLQAQADIDQAKRDLRAKHLVGRRKVKKGKKTVLVGGHLDYVLKGGARRIRNAELRAAQLNLQEIKAQYAYDIAAPERQAQIDADKNRAQAQKDAAKALASSTGDLSGDSGIFARGTSAGGALSSINRQIADVSTYGQIVSQLRAAGASPGLLAQVVSKGESGDLRSAIRMGRALLAQPEAIKGLNASLAELNRVSTSVATYTNSAAFASGQGSLAAPVSVSREVTVKVDPTSDPTELIALMSSRFRHIVKDELAAQAGVGG